MSRGWRPWWAVASIAGLAIAGVAGCDKPGNRTRDEAAVAAAIDQARREVEAADRLMRERAAQEELARREAEQAEIDARTAEEEARKASITRLEQRLRAVLLEPSTMQIRRVVVSDIVISFDQDPDDNYREPQHRFASIGKVTSCY